MDFRFRRCFLRRLAAFSLVGAGVLMNSGPSQARIITVEPDRFSESVALTHVFPGVTLSIEGRPDATVRSKNGFSDFNGRNLATTGSRVFGYEPELPPIATGQVWDEENFGLLRADFRFPTDFVQIDLIFDDDDKAGLWAFDVSGALIGSVVASGDGRGPVPYVTATLEADSHSIAYITAGGVEREASFLDAMAFDFKPVPVPEPSALSLMLVGGLAWFGRKYKRNRPNSV